MQPNSKSSLVAYLVLVSLCKEGKLIITKPRERIQVLMCISRIVFILRREFHDNIIYHSGCIFTDVVCPGLNLSQTVLDRCCL